MRFSRSLRKVRGPKLRATLWGNYARRAAAYPSCCRLPVVLPPEKSHVIPPGVFQDLKSDRWNHAVFSTPNKSEGTQITCDIVGEPFVGELLGGRSEGLGGRSEGLGGASEGRGRSPHSFELPHMFGG